MYPVARMSWNDNKERFCIMRRIMKRKVLLLILWIILLLGVIGYAYFIEPNLLRVKCFSIETEKEIYPCKMPGERQILIKNIY